ncbi:hypothetical protein DAPPUDRAFT_260159 [Daphnia pulex]|uniref:Uncharacterized protein n=1 Tax=Daphnia pulex TaxID=6669 RepID=E9HIM1_DAPPU|nr:hypothetical protein DAPPUDRAFT_260159 [Daphnia pulex]|eukprot:EFX68419.1 hypothetical protein DAPPUDRAFT_260159 [Daphnia pulex]
MCLRSIRSSAGFRKEREEKPFPDLDIKNRAMISVYSNRGLIVLKNTEIVQVVLEQQNSLVNPVVFPEINDEEAVDVLEEANPYGIEEQEEEWDLDKWDDAQTVTMLKVFETLKPQFDAIPIRRK